MNSLTLYLILFTSFCIKDAWSKTHNHEFLKEVGVENRIKGGKQTTIEEHPYTVYLKPKTGPYTIRICAGVIISRHSILTAARCLEEAEYIDIRVGSTNRKSGGQQYSSSDFLSHPMYLAGERDYDLGAVIIPEGIKLDGNTVDIINVVDLGDDPTLGDTVTITGWGLTSLDYENSENPVNLKEAQLQVISRGDCEKGENSGITDKVFCATDENGKNAACPDDNGGPAVNENGLLAGIIYRYATCRPGEPQPILRFGEATMRAFITLVTV